MPASNGPVSDQFNTGFDRHFQSSNGEITLSEAWRSVVERVRQIAVGNPSRPSWQELYQFLQNTRLVNVMSGADEALLFIVQAETEFQYNWLSQHAGPRLAPLLSEWGDAQCRVEFRLPKADGRGPRTVNEGTGQDESLILPHDNGQGPALESPAIVEQNTARAEQFWQAAIEQLRLELPKPVFETYLQWTRFLAYDDDRGVFAIGVPNVLAQQWLSSRLSSTLARLLSGIMNRSITVEFQTVNVEKGETSAHSPTRISDSAGGRGQDSPVEPLEAFVLDPAYLTEIEKIIEPGAAIYYPRYFIRHLPHLIASEASLILAFQQIAYFRGFLLGSGEVVLETSFTEISRWSNLHRNLIEKYLSRRGSYLSHFVRKIPFEERYAGAQPGDRWEDERGFHWREGSSHYVLWKESRKCSLEVSAGVYKQARSLYRVLRSMPLAPADSERLSRQLAEAGVQGDPLHAIGRLLDLPRNEILPPEYTRRERVPEKLHSVEEVVLQAWGGADRQLAALVKAHARKLDEHLIGPERDLLVIPLYFIRNWMPLLASHEQFWAVVLLQDMAYAREEIKTYREHVFLKGGYKTIGSWVGSTAKTVAAWTHPFRSLETQNKKKREKFSPWFSLFVDEICRTRNNANGIDVDFNVLPFTPLAPGDALKFLLDNGITSFSLHDPSGRHVEINLQEDIVNILLEPGKQLNFNYTGVLISPECGAIELALPRGHLNPPVLGLTERAGYLKAKQQEAVEAWSDNSAQENQARSDEDAQDYEARSQENAQGRWSGSDEEEQETSSQSNDYALKMAPEAYYSALLKLLIIKLHGIKKSLYLQKTPSNPIPASNLEPIPGLMQDEAYIRWMEIDKEKEWGVKALLKSIGIHPWNANLLISEGATAKEIISWYLYVFTIPAGKITASRESVLVASLKESPHSPYPGPFERLASLPPEELQDLFRRAIRSYGGRVGDLDWDHALAGVKVMDLALLAERLGLARIIREAGT